MTELTEVRKTILSNSSVLGWKDRDNRWNKEIVLEEVPSDTDRSFLWKISN